MTYYYFITIIVVFTCYLTIYSDLKLYLCCWFVEKHEIVLFVVYHSCSLYMCNCPLDMSSEVFLNVKLGGLYIYTV